MDRNEPHTVMLCQFCSQPLVKWDSLCPMGCQTCQVCTEVHPPEEINMEWLLMYDFTVCEDCIVKYDMHIKDDKDSTNYKRRAMADVNGET